MLINTTEIFLIAMLIIFSLPYLVWRIAKTDYYAPLVVVQIIAGILLGPGILGSIFPGYYNFVFTPQVIQSLNGIAWWAVMLFVMIAGIELDLNKAWEHRVESSITAGFALATPLIFGCGAALLLLFGPLSHSGWIGTSSQNLAIRTWHRYGLCSYSAADIDFVDGEITDSAATDWSTHLALCQFG